MKFSSGRFFYPSIIFFVIILDQIVKILALFLGFSSACNRGIAFGQGSSLPNALIAGVVLVFIYYLFRIETKTIVRISIALIIGGGVSNIIDRVFRSCVVDFIDFRFWPSFNLADAAITIGVGILVLNMFGVMELFEEKFRS